MLNHGPIIRRWAILVGLVLSCACRTGPPDSAQARRLQLSALPFEVSGQDQGADAVGLAFSQSIVAGLSQVRDLEALVRDGGVPAADPTHVLSGTLLRVDRTMRVKARLRATGTDRVVWESTEQDIGTDLSSAASRLAREITSAMELAYPSLYPYIDDLTGGPQMSDSPLVARTLEARKRGAIGEWLELTGQLTEEFRDDPAAHAFNAWALTLSWDAAPTAETLEKLQSRLLALGRVDSMSPYDDLIRAYIYRSSGEPGQARVVYSWVLDGDAELSNTARAWALRQRALADLQVGDAAAARRNADEAVNLDPSKPQNLIALSKALEALDLLDEAAAAARQALALEPFNWRHQQRLGLIYSRAERFQEAIHSLHSSCDLGNSQEACANLAVTLGRAGKATEAQEAAAHAETLNGTAWGAYNLACYRALSGDAQRAIRDLRQAIELGFADSLIATDQDLDSLRGLAPFQDVAATIEERLTSRRRQSSTLFPWQS